jgi:predicted acetyltransferase
MTSEIRQLTEDDIPALVRIQSGAYPAVGRSADEWSNGIRRNMQEEPEYPFFGLFRSGTLLGAMRLFDFSMRLYEAEVLCGGVGAVAVDLLHKKEHVAREMIDFYLRHYRERGAPLAALYPFRPDFYRQMGFGYGSKMAQYRVKTSSLPRTSKEHIVELSAADGQALVDCYHRVAQRTHGLFRRSNAYATRIFEDKSVRILGYKVDDRLEGYLIIGFTNNKSFLHYELEVRALVYEHPAALNELLTFLHSQLDQVPTVIFNTQEEHFHHLFFDPRNDSQKIHPINAQETHVSSIGIMYRLLDLNSFFAALGEHNFGEQSCVLRLVVDDSFLHQGTTTLTVAFHDGRATVQPDATPDVELRLGIAEASALLMGSSDLKGLLRLGLAQISNPAYIGRVHRLLLAEEKPVCMTSF